MKNFILPLMLLTLAGCDWVRVMSDAPEPRPIGNCLENRLACDQPEKPKKSAQQPPQMQQPQPGQQTETQYYLPPDPNSQYQP